MAATKTRSGSNGASSTARQAGETVASGARQAGETVAGGARKSKLPLLVAGGTVAGLAGGLVLGGRRRHGLSALVAPQRHVLGVPIGRKNGLVRTAEALGKVATQLGSATEQAAGATSDVRRIREQLDKANRQSPIEVLIDALTHRRGAHKAEGG
jgi:hypothetical protein